MCVKPRKASGLTLVEIIFTLTLIIMILGLSMSNLKPGVSRAGPNALALALSDEFRAARQLAIRSGHPVAVGIPKGGGEVATSLFRLEGWNEPHVSWSKGYSGDYPELGFAAASWTPSAGTFSTTTTPPAMAKFAGFSLTDWIPTAHVGDSIFCFTPDGGVLSNNQPALDDRFTIVVGEKLTVSGGVAVGADAPSVVYLGQAGGVEVGAGTPGVSLPAGSGFTSSAFKARDILTPGATVNVSAIVVRPDPGAALVEGFCVPGQHVTLELYAYDEVGRQLFAKWTQTPPAGATNGTFSFPDGQSPVTALQGELERMEFVDTPPPGLDWRGAPAPTNGCFRGRWSWTVPINSQPGDQYVLEADVKDVKGEVTIQNGALPQITNTVAPEGRLIVERLNPNTGLWELVRMNPDGSGEKVLTPAGVEETLPSVDDAGTKIAFLQTVGGQTAVKVRSLSGGQEWTAAAPGSATGTYTSVSLSPSGTWVSFRDDHGPTGTGSTPVPGELITKTVDPTDPREFRRQQSWEYGFGPDARPVKKSRTGWSDDRRWMIWGHQSSLIVTDLNSPNLADPTVSDIPYIPGPIGSQLGPYIEQLYAPTYFETPTSEPRIMLSIGNVDAVLAHVPFDPTDPAVLASLAALSFTNDFQMIDLNGPAAGVGSVNNRDDFPSVSTDGRTLVLPRENMTTGARSALLVPWDGTANNFIAAPPYQEITQEIRSVIWVP